MKFYNYSVKDLLINTFGDETIKNMRSGKKFGVIDDKNNILPFSWRYADEYVRGLFLEEIFLEDTLIEDDYIVYLGKERKKNIAYITFLIFENELPFKIQPDYAHDLIEKWEEKGYKAYILSVCIAAENKFSNGRIYLCTHSRQDCGSTLYITRKLNNKNELVYSFDYYWVIILRKLMHAYINNNLEEYKCIFDKNIKITTGKHAGKKTLAEGITQVQNYLNNVSSLTLSYIKKNMDSAHKLSFHNKKIFVYYIAGQITY